MPLVDIFRYMFSDNIFISFKGMDILIPQFCSHFIAHMEKLSNI